MAVEQAESDLSREWSAAEQAIKIAEVITISGIAPAVMELRYAGRRMADALEAETPEIKERLLRDAAIHCQRARADAVDASIVVMRDATNRLSLKNLSDADRDTLIQLRTKLADAFDIVVSSRRSLEHRGEQYADLEALLPELFALYRALPKTETGADHYRHFVSWAAQIGTIGITALVGAFTTLAASDALPRIVDLIRGLFR
jgi:hypothetical protein